MKDIKPRKLEDMWASLNEHCIPKELKIPFTSRLYDYQGGLFTMLDFILTEEEKTRGWKRLLDKEKKQRKVRK